MEPKGHPVPHMERVWREDGEEDWVEDGMEPCTGCSACDLEIAELAATNPLPF